MILKDFNGLPVDVLKLFYKQTTIFLLARNKRSYAHAKRFYPSIKTASQ